MRAPTFWKEKTLLSTALLPVATLYGAIAQHRITQGVAKKLPVKIICIGNLVAGGAGKTPVALAIGHLLKSSGKKIHFLSRGYKGTYQDVVRVDREKHTAKEVGDEPLLLATLFTTWVARDRVKGAEAAIKNGAEIIIMDDGFQNPQLYKDCSLLVIDGQYGLGNKRVMPAGPLRETMENATKRASAIIMVGKDEHQVLAHFPALLPVLNAEIHTQNSETLKDKPVVAFCGIARPRKFYRSLQQTGCIIRETVSYPDHYHFTAKDLDSLLDKARLNEATLITTEKDYVRLPESIQNQVMTLPIQLAFADNGALLKVINEC